VIFVRVKSGIKWNPHVFMLMWDNGSLCYAYTDRRRLGDADAIRLTDPY